MTYGDCIRQMDDDQLASLLFIVQRDGFNLGFYEVDSEFDCTSISDWFLLIQSDRPDAPPKYGVM